ncbi:MAG: sugar phosphate isomerase/epimerase family protein [Opitutales bacterium]
MDACISIFPKFQKDLSLPDLAAWAVGVGLDGINIVLREGYWTPPAQLAETLPVFLKTLTDAGLQVPFCTAGLQPKALVEDPGLLRILADHGVPAFRLAYIRGDDDPRGLLREARQDLEALVPVLQAIGIKAVHQVHHGTLISSAFAAWHLIEGLPADAIGVELDPGNQAWEGFEAWGKSARLLGEHLCAVGVKDVLWRRESEPDPDDPRKGWRQDWALLEDGVVDWQALIDALRSIAFAGPLVLMPHYHPDNPEGQTAGIRRDVAYLKQLLG